MIVIIGLIVLLMAAIAGFAGILTNTTATHPLAENFSLLGYHVTGSTGTVFLFGIVDGAVAMLGLAILLAGARRTAGRGRDARDQLKDSQRETAFLNEERDQRIEHQQADTTTSAVVDHKKSTVEGGTSTLFGRWHGRRPADTAHPGRPR
ncbi:hypothetical protein [Mycolicibacterium aubagnense]|uniref:Uncharacterized protein n=1 Tax=Mycolicibacterium aubagnense TaxID=319707 RepID=A0ABM7I7C8_9MYCO|nr:hypothetical protein [Mycolicibacterium aubagnense]TLH63044.1 hypothetical protein C1S80_13885 [Mycolicibacterium aubagnense]WGI30627.1 hypothetical protein QDT91_15075 [Mycolicibacterium aubagnense]BBX82447.1 hypothetical protein MAUB_03200 [Mycolicibacterium aubagnense]